MLPESKKFLADMLAAATLIQQFAAGRTLDDLDTDKLLRSRIYYQFAIIGEALSQVRMTNPSVLDRISEAPRIIAFRNQILHGYSVIQDNVTWQIIQDKLPILKKELENILAE